MYNKCGKMKIDMVEVESIENRIEILQNRLHKGAKSPADYFYSKLEINLLKSQLADYLGHNFDRTI